MELLERSMVVVVGYGLFSLCVIHKEDLCPSSGDINRLMMMIYFFVVNAIICIENT
jgi:hypothetical protein